MVLFADFFSDFDGVSAEALEGLDAELQQMKKSLEVEAPEVGCVAQPVYFAVSLSSVS